MKQNHVNANQCRGNMKTRYRENEEFEVVMLGESEPTDFSLFFF